jgi:hypothetical protein
MFGGIFGIAMVSQKLTFFVGFWLMVKSSRGRICVK